jgi:hypothetical protein
VIQNVIAGSTASQQLAAAAGRAVGRGYLDLTGYGKALRL